MDVLFIYLLQSSVCMAVLYGVYWAFLRKDTFFATNRFYLTGSLVLSLLIPLFRFELNTGNNDEIYGIMLDTVTISSKQIQSGLNAHLNLYETLTIIYLTGVGLFCIRLLWQLVQLFRLQRKHIISRENGLRLVLTEQPYSPFSFFHLIFINKQSLTGDEVDKIIQHEAVHVKQMHSMDLMLVELVTILQWFNPVVWLYRFAIKKVHEYLADEGVLKKGVEALDYQTLLLQLTTGIQVNDLTNNFNQFLIKNRIIMMTKMKSNTLARLKVLLALPLAAGLLFAFACNRSEDPLQQQDETAAEQVETSMQQVPVTATDAVAPVEDEVFAVVDEQPQFPGGDKARIEFMIKEMKYPKAAIEAGKQGTVYVGFVVEKDGAITGAKVLRGFDDACDAEALRVVNAMPNWVAGKQRGKAVRVQFNMPFRFSLN